MSARTSFLATAWPLASRYANLAIGGVIVAGGLFLLLALRLGWIEILPASSEAAPEAAVEPAAPTTVQLTPEKLAAADLHTTTARMAPIQLPRPVPATITYDAARRVPVNSPVAGVVGRVLVEPGQQVAEHQPLAELSSPEVGLARDEVLRRAAESELARKQLTFSEQIAKNVDE